MVVRGEERKIEEKGLGQVQERQDEIGNGCAGERKRNSQGLASVGRVFGA